MANIPEQQWWRKSTVYQVYPKSFKDTTGSGTGDIKGLTRKLDYLQDMGIDIVWLQPVYVSPQNDNGYDVADYRRIDPAFGTMEDFDELMHELKKRGMHLMTDIVVNHSSTEHPYFRKPANRRTMLTAIIISGKMRHRTAALPTTGSLSLADLHGSGRRQRASIF